MMQSFLDTTWVPKLVTELLSGHSPKMQQGAQALETAQQEGIKIAPSTPINLKEKTGLANVIDFQKPVKKYSQGSKSSFEEMI